MDKPYFRFLGDVHGERESYFRLLRKNHPEYTLQVGDLDFDYDHLNEIDSKRHRFIGGNHDNYDQIPQVEHSLGDFGVWSVPDFGDIFFVRGAWSIDHKARVSHNVVRRGKIIRKKDFWEEEELTYEQCEEALKLYEKIKPKFVVTHTCPLSVVPYVGNPLMTHSWGYDSVIKTKTTQLLQAMTEIHRPKVHVFGHFHTSLDKEIEGTRYICLGILRYMDFPKHFAENL